MEKKNLTLHNSTQLQNGSFFVRVFDAEDEGVCMREIYYLIYLSVANILEVTLQFSNELTL